MKFLKSYTRRINFTIFSLSQFFTMVHELCTILQLQFNILLWKFSQIIINIYIYAIPTFHFLQFIQWYLALAIRIHPRISTIPQFYEFSTIPQTSNFTFPQVCTFPLISRTNMPQYHLAGFYTPAHRHNIYTQFENSICARVILPSHFTVPYLSIEKNTTTH